MTARAPVTLLSSSTTSIVLGRCAFTLLFLDVQVDPNSSSFTEGAIDPNRAPVFFNNLFRVRHTETESAGLIGIERLENFLNPIFVHSRPRIIYYERKHFARSGPRDIYNPAARHRLDRIENEIQQGSTHASFVKHGGGIRVFVIELNLDSVLGYL